VVRVRVQREVTLLAGITCPKLILDPDPVSCSRPPRASSIVHRTLLLVSRPVMLAHRRNEPLTLGYCSATCSNITAFFIAQRHNAQHQRRAQAMIDKKIAYLRVRCMPLLDCGFTVTPFFKIDPSSFILLRKIMSII